MHVSDTTKCQAMAWLRSLSVHTATTTTQAAAFKAGQLEAGATCDSSRNWHHACVCDMQDRSGPLHESLT